MKKTISLICSAALIMTLAGCNKKESLYGESTAQNAPQTGTGTSESFAGNGDSSGGSESSVPSAIPLQNIANLRGDLEAQVNIVKNSDYKNLHLAEDFVVKVPDADILYDLTLTKPTLDFKTAYEIFDKAFDKEFGDIYTQEDKEKLYHVEVVNKVLGDFNSESTLLVNHIDKLISGEYTFADIYVCTDKAYLTVKPVTTGIHGLNHDGVIKRAKDEDRTVVALSFATDYFDVVKNYLDIDSEDRFEILDSELSVKEATEMAKKIVSENEYSWGGALDPDVYQVKLLDIGEGKYGFSFTMTPSYKGVLFDSYEFPRDGSMGTRTQKFDHDYELFMPRAFMMENGKFDSFSGVGSEYSVTEDAEHDSVISFEDSIRILSEKFGGGMNLSLSRAELIYTGMYPVNEEDYSVMKSFPVWKFRCHNTTDNLKYVVYINAVNGNIEYYVTDWWEV